MRAALEAEADELGADELYRRLAASDPVAADRIEPGNVRRTIRALEVTAITGAPFSEFAAAWEVYDPARVRVAGHPHGHERPSTRGSRGRVASMLEAGWVREVEGLVERGFGAWLTASQAIGYAELAAHLDGRLALDEAMTQTVKRTKELARRQQAWFRRDPRIEWFDAGEGGAVEVVPDVAGLPGGRVTRRLSLSKYQASGNDFLVVDELDGPVGDLDVPAHLRSLVRRRRPTG